MTTAKAPVSGRDVIVRSLCKSPCRYPDCTCAPEETRAEFERDADAILAALAEQGLSVEQGWKPIESAPKDGTRILVTKADEDTYSMLEVFWSPESDAGGACWLLDWSHEEIVHQTHWMPLPPPPQSGGERKE